VEKKRRSLDIHRYDLGRRSKLGPGSSPSSGTVNRVTGLHLPEAARPLVRDNHQMDQLDPEGYIRPEADLANVQPEYQA
jgi:hypothetical protein